MNLLNKTYQIIIMLVVILIALASPQRLYAQEFSGAFIMSSVGLIENFANNSMAVSFSNSSTCFNVQNGAAVIIGERGTGLFVNNCTVDTKFNILGLKLFPNPVNTITKIKFISISPLTDEYVISVWNAEGIKLITRKAFGYELYQGMLIDMSRLSAGTFILKLESDKYGETLKFIKAK